jgi:hypothetical protein
VIVKVQWPLAGELSVLVYNRDRSIQQMFGATDDLREKMFGDKPPTPNKAKQYFFARISKRNNLVLLERAPRQRW